MSLSLWAEMSSSSDKWLSEFDSNTSTVKSGSETFFLLATLLNAPPHNSHTPNPTPSDSHQISALPGLLHAIALMWNGHKH